MQVLMLYMLLNFRYHLLGLEIEPYEKSYFHVIRFHETMGLFLNMAPVKSVLLLNMKRWDFVFKYGSCKICFIVKFCIYKNRLFLENTIYKYHSI